MNETGRVVAIEGDGVWVETLKSSTCSQCAAKYGCGQKLLASVSPASDMTLIKAFFTEKTSGDAWSVGDEAVLSIEDNALVLAAFIAYGIPLVLLIVGMFIGARVSLFDSVEVSSLIGAIIGFLVGGWVVRFHATFTRESHYFQAQVIGRKISFINT